MVVFWTLSNWEVLEYCVYKLLVKRMPVMESEYDGWMTGKNYDLKT